MIISELWAISGSPQCCTLGKHCHGLPNYSAHVSHCFMKFTLYFSPHSLVNFSAHLIFFSENMSAKQFSWMAFAHLRKEYGDMNKTIISSYGHQSKDLIVSCDMPGSSNTDACDHRWDMPFSLYISLTRIFEIRHSFKHLIVNKLNKKPTVKLRKPSPLRIITEMFIVLNQSDAGWNCEKKLLSTAKPNRRCNLRFSYRVSDRFCFETQ